jgi:spermidine synthase/S-adenosylmethionine decarboxylase
MNGLHITADLYDCPDGAEMRDAGRLAAACLAAVAAAGLETVAQVFHQFGTAAAPAGATGAVVLAESHVAVHTWPELAAVTLDIYVCNFSRDNEARAEALYARLLELFRPGRSERQNLRRGSGRAD